MLPVPLQTSKLEPLETGSKNAFTNVRTRGAYLYHTILTGSHVELWGKCPETLFRTRPKSGTYLQPGYGQAAPYTYPVDA